MANQYFSTSEAAKICQVTPGSVIRWIKEGKLETAVTAGGHRRIPAASLLNLVKRMGLNVPEGLVDPDSIPEQFHPRILIVDDDKAFREMVRWFINQEWPEADVQEAQDGFIAGWKTHGFRPNLVILDLMMPNLDGFRYCEFIKKMPEMNHTRIIAISGVSGKGNEDRIMNLGANVFLAKPFDNEVFKNTIETQLKLLKEEW
ncbi:MAG: hypothetical protein AUJ71_00045 [Candidatus Omnitrophica bacterium CG1_02_49_16]|nr:MAG: hypothetical protein AUJ71_00045 [Candidatus Omnitrophica bacterium CG1_02_49_16]